MDDRRFNTKVRRPFWKRKKDYDHFQTFGVPIGALPSKLLFVSAPLDQDGKFACTSTTINAIQASRKGKEYDWEKFWNQELDFMGVKDSQGTDLETPFKVAISKGFIPLGSDTPQDKIKGYFSVNKISGSGMDTFDAIRFAINQIKCPIAAGLIWYSEWDNAINGIIPHTFNKKRGGHDNKIAGFLNCDAPEIGFSNPSNTEYLVIQSSFGPNFPRFYFFDRYMANKCFVFDNLYPTDDVPSDVARINLIDAVIHNLINLWTQLLKIKLLGNFGIPPYLWDNPNNARRSVRVICDEEGLFWDDKNILTACVAVESGFNPGAIHENKNLQGEVLSTDYGIVQVNDYWHIGPNKDFPSVDYVLNNPEACVRWMARLFKAGKQNLWSSYNSGAYKRYL